MTKLQRAVAARRTAEEHVRACEDHILRLHRRDHTFAEAHEALRALALAMISMNDELLKLGELAGVKANSAPDPIIEHEE